MAESKRVHIEKAQNFMRQYRDPESRELKKLSANQFMDVWSHYDRDGKCANEILISTPTTFDERRIVLLARKKNYFLFLSRERIH